MRAPKAGVPRALLASATGAFALVAVALNAPSAQAADLAISSDTQLPSGIWTYDACAVAAGVTLTIATDPATGLPSELHCASLDVAAGGRVSVDAQGFAAGAGPGAGDAGGGGAGVGDGGIAGPNGGGGLGGSAPWDGASAHFGSGGSGTDGGAGGGALVVVVTGAVTLDGVISANGAPGPDGGGGGGGTIQLSFGSLSGSGGLEARGGAGANGGGGGGGGLLDVTGELPATVTLSTAPGARGGSDARAGGAGLQLTRPAGVATWRFDGEGAAEAATPWVGSAIVGLLEVVDGADVTLRQGADLTATTTTVSAARLTAAATTALGDVLVAAGSTLRVDAPCTASALVVAAGGLVTHSPGSTGVDLLVGGDATIAGAVDATGLGFGPDAGPAAGVSGVSQTGGAGGANGGRGGRGGGNGDDTDDTEVPAVAWGPGPAGSGGGSCGDSIGGKGGGVIRLEILGNLELGGTITADGTNGDNDGNYYAAGGGAGGSITVIAGAVTVDAVASPSIHADGGAGGSGSRAKGGGGGGGRIHVEAAGASEVWVRAYGGAIVHEPTYPNLAGGAGTVLIVDGEVAGDLLVETDDVNPGTPLDAGVSTLDAVLALDHGTVAVLAGSAPTVTGPAIFDGDAGLLLDATLTVEDALFTGDAWATSPVGSAAFALHASGDITLGPRVVFDVTGKGHGPGEGPAAGDPPIYQIGATGGAHGGNGGGGTGDDGTAPQNADVDDSLTAPTLLGSGGGTHAGGNCTGGKGGGRVALSAGGTLTLDGFIRADGTSSKGGSSNWSCGGGAGGTVTLTADRVVGGGLVTANGGHGEGSYNSDGGGGGGGRIAVRAALSSSLVLEAKGGEGPGPDGGAGTVAVLDAGGAILSVIADNHSVDGALTPIDLSEPVGTLLSLGGAHVHLVAGADADVDGPVIVGYDSGLRLDRTLRAASLTAQPGAVLDHSPGATGFRLIAAEDVAIAAGASVDVSGLGYGPDEGPGAGVPGISDYGAGGGGHGGIGGRGGGDDGGADGGAAHDSALAPTDLGSGGGSGGNFAGGAGGGRAVIEAGGQLLLDGVIEADGFGGKKSSINYAGGGGAGGTVDLTAAAVVGAGSISVIGGPGGNTYDADGGGGGGGRLRIDAPVVAITWTTAGGDSPRHIGGAGTCYLAAQNTLAVRGGEGPDPNWTPLSEAALTLDGLEVEERARATAGPATTIAVAGDVVVRSGGELRLANGLTARDVTIEDTGTLSVLPESDTFLLAVAGDLDLQAGGHLSGDLAGHPGETGPGAGGTGRTGELKLGGGGGGYGCLGGIGKGDNGGGAGGPAYGSAGAPTDKGSGGGHSCGNMEGGAGGGRVVVRVDGAATLDGLVSSDGGSGEHTSISCASGGGSGGTIDIAATSLAGAGEVRAGGGTGANIYDADGGGGGGGRVLIRAASGALDNAPTAPGGPGGRSNPGCDGSVVTDTLPADVADLAASTGGSDGEIDLSWTSPAGADPAQTVEIRALDAAITAANWADAPVVGSTSAAAAGSPRAHTVTGLVAGRTYHLALRLRTADGAPGALSNSASSAAAGDDLPPDVVTDLAITPGAGATFQLTWTAPDDEGGGVAVTEIRYQALAAPFDWAAATPIAEAPPAPVSGQAQTLDVASLPAGATVRLGLVTRDQAGNEAPVSNQVVADQVDPTVSLDSPTDGATLASVVTLTATASDDVGVVAVAFALDGAPLGEDTTPDDGFTLSWDPATTTAEQHTLSATARDAAGREATAQITVDASPAAPGPPVILTPPDGYVGADAALDVTGTLDSGASPTLYVDGVATAAVPSVDATRQLTLDLPGGLAWSDGCVPTGDGTALTLPEPVSHALANVALNAPVTATGRYSSNYEGSEVTDGVLEDGSTHTGYWLAPNAVAASLTVDLGVTHALERVELFNSRNAGYSDRSTADFRLEGSVDGQTWTLIEAGTLVEDDIETPYVVTPTTGGFARWLRFNADTWYENGAGLSELRAFGRPAVGACRVKVAAIGLDPAQVESFIDAAAVGSANDGTLGLRFSQTDTALTDTFTGAAVDADRWAISEEATPGPDGLSITGADSWGARFVYSRQAFERADHGAVRFRVTPNDANLHVGLRRLGAGTDYDQLAHSIRFDGDDIRIYEDGSHRTLAETNVDLDIPHEVRFLIAPGGRVASEWRADGEQSWTRIYTSTYAGDIDRYQVVVTVYDGTATVHEITVSGPDWRPVAELAAATPVDAPLWLEATLQRERAGDVAPILDALTLRWRGTGGDGGPTSFRFDDVALATGTHALEVGSENAAGTAGPRSAPVSVTLDSTPPAAITDLSVVKGGPEGDLVLAFTAPGDDAGAGTATSYDVRWSLAPLTEATWAAGRSAPAAAPQAAGAAESVTVSGLEAGVRYWLAVKAVDDLGNAGAISNVVDELAKDGTPPSLYISDPSNNTHHRGQVPVTFTSYDNVGVVNLTLTVGGVEVGSDSEEPWEILWDTTAFADGEYTAVAESVDADGNTRTYNRTFFADNTPPVVSIAPFATPRTGGVVLDVSATDNLSAVDDLVVRDQDGLPGPFDVLADGAQTVTVSATDLAGNTGSDTAVVTVDRLGPAAVLDLTAVSDPGTPETVTLAFTAPADQGGSVASFEVRAAPVADLAATLLGDGADGPLVVSAPTTLDAPRTTLSVSVAPGDTALTVVDPTGLAVGDEVLLHASRCDLDALAGAGRTTWGRVVLGVTAVDAQTVTLDGPIGQAFDADACTVAVQRVPNYTTVTVTAGGVLSAPAYDGATGGILALRASGAVVVEEGGALSADGAGYRGSGVVCGRRAHGTQGESQLRQTLTASVRPSLGGGGGGIGSVSGTPDGPNGAGGGGGGHGTPGQSAAPYNDRPGGAGGVVTGSPDLRALVFGGAGGQAGADEDGGAAGGGGDGGGAVLVTADYIVNRGVVRADGDDGLDGCNGCGDAACGGSGWGMGGGGGGAGGAIWLSATTALDVAVGRVEARGGAGGVGNGPSGGGPGGDGGDGRIRLDGPGAGAYGDPAATAGALPAFDWSRATPVAGVPAPAAPGATVSFDASPYDAGETWAFALRSADDLGNVSGLSNVAIRDLTPPTVAFVAPVDGATVTGPGDVVVEVGDDAGAAEVALTIDGADAGRLTAPPWRFPWLEPAAGAHTLVATVTDGGGRTASDTIDVTVTLAPPAPPTLDAPADGTLQSALTTSVAGTTEANTRVAVRVGGAVVATVDAVQAEVTALDATSPTTWSSGCAVVGDALVIDDAAPDSATDLAHADRSATAAGGTAPDNAIDGVDDDPGATWSIAASQGEGLTYLGRVTLARAELAETLTVTLPTAAATYNYKAATSPDGDVWTTWFDGTGDDADYQGAQALTRAPTLVRYVDLWISGTTSSSTGEVLEVAVFRPVEALACLAESGFAATPGATVMSRPETLGAGALETRVATAGLLVPESWGDLSDFVFDDATVEADGSLTLDGTGGWGDIHVFTAEAIDRAVLQRFEMTLTPLEPVGMMVGLKRPGPSVGNGAMVPGVFVSGTSVVVYDLGDHIGTFGSIEVGESLDVRFDVGPSDVHVFVRWPGEADYTHLYTSTYHLDPGFQLGVTGYYGAMSVSPPRATGLRWRDPADAAIAGVPNDGLRWRTVLRRALATDPSPSLEGWRVATSDGTTGGAGLALFRTDDLPLSEGLNTLTAVATRIAGDQAESAPSAAVNVTVDNGPPAAPDGLVANALAGGAVVLSWLAPAGESGLTYRVYRSGSTIADQADIDGLTPIATGVGATTHGDLPGDGSWHYAIVAVDAAGNPSPPSAEAVAQPDATAPTGQLALSPGDAVLGPQTVTATLTVSETVAETPTLDVVLADESEVAVTLTDQGGGVFEGTFEVLASWPSGDLSFAFAAVDGAGNVGTTLTSAPAVAVDTRGPVGAVATTPDPPLAAGDVVVTLTLDEAAATAPTLLLTPSGGVAVPIALTGSGAAWSGTLTVDETTGDGVATFSLYAEDAYGNPGETLSSGALVAINAEPPAAPTALTATKHPAGWFDLDWAAPADPDPLTFRVYRAQGTDIGGATLLAADLGTAEYTDVPPASGDWTYAVSAVDDAGNEGLMSAPVTVLADPPPPEDPTDLTVVGATSTTIEIAWTASANTSGLLAGYRVYRDGAMVASLGAGATSHTLTNLSPAAKVALKVSAFDTNNHEGLGAALDAWTLMPNPTGVAATGHDQSVAVSWVAVADAAPLLHYAVHVSTSPIGDVGGLSAAAVNPGGTSATVNGLDNGTTYYVAVTSVNKSGLEETAVTSVSATPGDDSAPEPPTEVVVTDVTATTLGVAWTASANSSGDLAGYEVSADGGAPVAVGPTETSATLTGLAAASAVDIDVVSVDTLGNRTAPAEAVGYTRMPHPSGVTVTPHDESLKVDFTRPSPLANIAAFRVYVLAASFDSVASRYPAVEVPASAHGATVGGLTNGTTYYLAVTTVNQSGDEDPAVVSYPGTPYDDAAPRNATYLHTTAVGLDWVALEWTAPTDADGDLDALVLTADGDVVANLDPAITTHVVEDLLPASKVAFRLVSVDAVGNESDGVTTDGYTWLPNPTDVAVAEPLHERLRVTFTRPSPQANIKHFAVYVQPAAFSDVTGLTPVKTVTSSASEVLVTGLTNGVPAHVAVATVNKSNGGDPAVVSVVGTPVVDTTGPALSDVRYDGAALADGGTITVDGTLSVSAVDPVGVAYVRFLLDGNVVGTDQSATGGYGVDVFVDGLSEGQHLLHIDAADVLGNSSALEQTVQVQHAPPAAPVITAPADGASVNSDKVLVTGTARPGSRATIYRDGAEALDLPVDGTGGFSGVVVLASGANTLTATATGIGGEGPASTPVQVLLDDVVPTPPRALTATATEGGVVKLRWYDDGTAPASGLTEYRLYRAQAAFDDVAEATLIASVPKGTTPTFEDLPPSDATWTYRVTVVSGAGTESAPSPAASATSDATPPRATEITWTPLGAYLDPRYGVGSVRVEVTFSEPLAVTPFLSLAPEGGAPIAITLVKVTETLYAGTTAITASTPSGTALAVLSARDKVLNRGSVVELGASIEIDTDAPDVAALTLSPASPIQNDAASPETVNVTLTLTEPLPAGESPQLEWRLATSHPDGTELPLAPSPVVTDGTTWVGGFILPDEGGATAEALVFTYLGVDDLGNESTTILGPSQAEVFQGALPALPAPLGLTGEARPGGLVHLEWAEVPGAAEYVVLRGDPQGSALAELDRVTDPTYDDDPGQDGQWRYAVASVRVHDTLETESEPSPPVAVLSDRTPPLPAEDLALSLTPSGIRLVWTSPAGQEPVTWRIYRSATDPLTDIAGLSPLVTDIDVTDVIDPTPSDTEHTYVVVAEDAAGNLSPPSPSGYLNAGLLPVPTISAVDDGETGTTLSWTHQSPSVVAFDVTVDGLDAPESPMVERTLLDPEPATAARTYGVTAIDGADMRSLERTLTRPAVTVTVPAGAAAQRGVIDTFELLVTSDTSLPASFGATLAVTTGGRTFTARDVTLLANEATTVPVVVGLPADSAATEAATASLAFSPEAGASVEIRRALDVPTTPASYSFEVLTEDFVRGASGTARLRVYNPFDATMELVTARQSGQLPSDEIRFELTDLDGNLLHTAALDQATGTDVIGLGGGTVVARIPPGGTYTSGPVSLPVPEAAPDRVRVRVVVDAVHHDLGKADHVELPGSAGVATVSLVAPPYVATVDSALPAVSSGDVPVTLSGSAVLTDGGAPAADVVVELHIAVAGFERTANVVTDGAGAFSHDYTPLPGEGGVYDVWASYPGLEGRASQASFTIERLVTTPESFDEVLAANYPKALTVDVQALAGAQATNLRVEAGEALPTGLTLTPGTPVDLSGPATAALTVTLAGDNLAPSEGTTYLNLVSDERTWGQVPLAWTITSADPVLTATPQIVVTGVARGDQVIEEITLRNEGLIQLSSPSLTLLTPQNDPAPAWIYLASAAEPGPLAVGDETVATLVIAPGDQVTTTLSDPYAFKLRVKSGDDVVGDVPVEVYVDDSGVGGVLFHAIDIYTGTIDEDTDLPVPGLAGARIELTKTFGLAHEVTLTTDANGEALFTDLPTGIYRFRATAADHNGAEGTLNIKPGVTQSRQAFLGIDVVTFEWDVTEISIEDRYEIVLEATFETDVPAPVVVAEPTSTPMPELAEGEVFYGEYTLTNYGLIRADDLNVSLPNDDEEYRFELLTEPPTSLDAHRQITIAYRITRVAAADDAGGGGSGGCGRVASHCYRFVCAAGVESGSCTSKSWSSDGDGCGGRFRGRLGGGGGGIGWLGRLMGGSPACDPCHAPGMSEAEQDCCHANQGEETGSSVQVITGLYTDYVTDLTYGVLGHDLAVTRDWDGSAWTFAWLDDGGLALGDETITYAGVDYERVDDAGTLYRDSDRDREIRKVDGGWELHDRAGDVTLFGEGGALAGLRDLAGREVTFERDGSGNLERMRDHFGDVALTFTWAGGELTSVTAADGRTVGYGWQDGQLVSVTRPDGGELGYAYADDLLVQKSLPSGRVLTITYGDKGQVASVLDGDGVGYYFDYGYDDATRQNYAATLFTDGRIRERWYDSDGALAKELVDGEPVLEVAPDAVLRLDDEGEATAAIDADGTIGQTWTRDARGRVTRSVDRAGVERTYTYNANGQVASTTVTAPGQAPAQTSYVYDTLGRMIETRQHGASSEGDAVWTLGYDAHGNLVDVEFPTLAGSPSPSIRGTHTFNGARQPTSTRWTDGTLWEQSYDPLGRPLELTLTVDDGAPVVLESHVYGETFDGAGAQSGRTDTVTDALGRTTVQHYDRHDRLVKTVDPWGRTTTRSYDAHGREVSLAWDDGVLQTRAYETLLGGGERETVEVDGEVVRVHERDAYGRDKRIVEHGVEALYFYDGDRALPVEVRYPGLSMLYERDARRNPTRVRWVFDDESVWSLLVTWQGLNWATWERNDGATGARTMSPRGDTLTRTNGLGVTEVWDYSPWGGLRGLTDGRGVAVMTNTVDPLGNISARTVPDGATLTTSWDRRQQPLGQSWDDGTTVTYTRDPFGNVTAIDATSPTAADRHVTATYDLLSRPLTATSAEAAMTIARDDFARTETVTVDFGAFSKSYTRRFDARERVIGLDLPSGEAIAYTRRADGTLSGLDVPGIGAVAVERPGAFVDRLATEDGLTITTTRMASGGPRSIIAAASGTPVVSRVYTLDTGLVTDITTLSGSYTYGYDKADQIVAASYPTLSAETFAYDPAGNRVAGGGFGDAAWTVDTSGRLTEIAGEATFTWDAHGNLASRTDGGGTLAFEYDALDRLTRVTDGDGAEIASYGYDAADRRVRKTVGGVTTYFLWSDEGLLAEYDATGGEIRAYGWRPQTELGEAPVWVRTGGATYLVVPDHFGAPVALLTAGGEIAWRAEYRAFGEAVTEGIVTLPLRGSAQYHDAETGLHYNFNRYYAPDLGRYTRRDPLWELGGGGSLAARGFDLYGFANNAPTLAVDRYGLSASINIDGDGSKGEICVGGDAGVGFTGGGEVCGGEETKDCCKQDPEGGGSIVKGGQTCTGGGGSISGGIGASMRAFGVGFSSKTVGTKAGGGCYNCNKCGEQSRETKCCGEACAHGPKAKVGIVEGSLIERCKKVCHTFGGGTRHYDTTSGPKWGVSMDL